MKRTAFCPAGALRLQQTPSPLSRCTSPARLTRYCLSRLRLCESGAPPLHSETQPSRQAEHRSTPPDRSLDTAVGGDGRGGSGGGAGGPNGGGGSGGANGDDGSRGVDPELLGVMLAYQRALSSLPAELQEAVRHGWLTRTQLAGYLSQDRSWMSWLLRWPMLRNRVLCDPEFMFKLWVQEWVGNGTQLVGELLVRGREIVDELEYVLADLVVGTVVEASFVVLLAPAMPFLRRPPSAAPATRGTGAVLEAYRRWSLSLPANAFEASIPPARVYSLTSRFITVVNASAQYFAIGVVCGLVGTALTYGMLEARRLFDPAYQPLRPQPPVLPNSIGWGAFMALSSNPRFQLVEGLERLSQWVLRRHPMANRAVIIALRLANNFYGGIHFVQFFRWTGLQTVAEATTATTDAEVLTAGAAHVVQATSSADWEALLAAVMRAMSMEAVL